VLYDMQFPISELTGLINRLYKGVWWYNSATKGCHMKPIK